jgi:hypothetical protein
VNQIIVNVLASLECLMDLRFVYRYRESDNNECLTTLECLMDLRFVYRYRESECFDHSRMSYCLMDLIVLLSYGSALHIYALITPYYIRESDNNFLTTFKCVMDLRFVYMWHDKDTGDHYQKDYHRCPNTWNSWY